MSEPRPVEERDPVAERLAAVRAALPEQARVRHNAYDRLVAAGIDPYPVGFDRTATFAQVRDRFGDLPPATATGTTVSVTGRVVRSRDFGGLCFATLRDGTGDLQLMLSADRSGADSLRTWGRNVDLGDHVGVVGEVVTSDKGELSVLAESWTITAKCLRPLPDKRRGLSDPEARVRQRYVDLIVNPDARRMLQIRSAAVRAVRDHLAGRDYLEVETPMLQPVHGGANARPFVTHINAYDMRLYLRIAPELYLKRLMVGGTEKVFELNRNFRNEGADATHNPEFTMLEAYEAYGDYNTMQTLMQEMIQEAARAALGGTVVTHEGIGVRHRRAVAFGDGQRGHLAGARGGDHGGHPGGAAPAALRPGGDPLRPEVGPRRGRPGDVRAPRRGPHARADVLPGLPHRRVAADPPAPGRSPAGRAVGPGLLRRGDRYRLLRAGRPGRAAQAPHRAVVARRRWRRRRRWSSTRTSSPRSSTPCRPRAGWAWASTAWS